jgi:hypothetical protein
MSQSVFQTGRRESEPHAPVSPTAGQMKDRQREFREALDSYMMDYRRQRSARLGGGAHGGEQHFLRHLARWLRQRPVLANP